jgi:hypothetical protein
LVQLNFDRYIWKRYVLVSICNFRIIVISTVFKSLASFFCYSFFNAFSIPEKSSKQINEFKLYTYYRTWLYIWVTLRVIRSRNCLPFPSTWVHTGLLVGSVLLIVLDLCVVLLCVFAFWIPCCGVRYDFRIQDVRFVFAPICL